VLSLSKQQPFDKLRANGYGFLIKNNFATDTRGYTRIKRKSIVTKIRENLRKSAAKKRGNIFIRKP
jgi:hypothetical protein